MTQITREGRFHGKEDKKKIEKQTKYRKTESR